VKASDLPIAAASGAGTARVDAHRGIVPSLRRIRALIRRHAYLLLKSWPRLVSMMYYPTVTMVLWAFVTIYLAPTNRFLTDAPGFFIGAVLLWDVLFRGQLGVSLTFIEEVYARNLGNLFVSPLRLHEFIAGQLIMSVLRTLIGVGGACLFAWLLFHYSIFTMGLPLVAFFTCLLAFGWAIGLAVSAMILRYGLGAEELTRRIRAARAALGERVVILGHHYQREDIIEFATGPGFFKVEQDRALALVDDAVEARQIDAARAQEQLETARAELERAESGESDADRWQLEQRIRHAENQLNVAGRA